MHDCLEEENTLNHSAIGAGMRIGCNLAAVAVRKTRTISAALVFVNLSFKVTVSNVTFYLLKLTTIYNFAVLPSFVLVWTYS